MRQKRTSCVLAQHAVVGAGAVVRTIAVAAAKSGSASMEKRAMRENMLSWKLQKAEGLFAEDLNVLSAALYTALGHRDAVNV